jgi:hypothetical protein
MNNVTPNLRQKFGKLTLVLLLPCFLNVLVLLTEIFARDAHAMMRPFLW